MATYTRQKGVCTTDHLAPIQSKLNQHNLSRKELAVACGMSYGALNSRMLGFRSWMPGDVEKVMKVLDAMIKERKAK